MFNSPFSDGTTPLEIFLVLGVALVAGFIFSLLTSFKSRSTKGFLITTSIIPMVVALIIILVNGNIGAGIAIAGAFSLVRFRSAPGTAKEICAIFISMAAGLAFGMGYIAYAIIFMLVLGLFLFLFERINIFNRTVDVKERIIRVTIPEELDYTEIFDDVFATYTSKCEVTKVKTINMGSMFIIYYNVTLKNVKDEKKLIDDIRVRNGNLEVSIQRVDFDKSEL